MRCEVVRTQDMSSSNSMDLTHINTDIEIWREATAYHTALTPAGPRDLARVSVKSGLFPRNPAPPPSPHHHCPRSEAPPTTPTETDNITADVCDNTLLDSSVPPKQQRLSELQKLKANCKPEELQKLKTRCEVSKIYLYQ